MEEEDEKDAGEIESGEVDFVADIAAAAVVEIAMGDEDVNGGVGPGLKTDRVLPLLAVEPTTTDPEELADRSTMLMLLLVLLPPLLLLLRILLDAFGFFLDILLAFDDDENADRL